MVSVSPLPTPPQLLLVLSDVLGLSLVISQAEAGRGKHATLLT